MCSTVLAILIHVALKNLLDGSQEPAEGLAVQQRHLQIRSRHDIGSARFVFKKRSLAEVVALLVLGNAFGWLAGHALGSDGGACHHNIEHLTRLALRNHVLPLLEPLFLDSVGQLVPLVLFHVLEDGDLLQKFLILLTLVLSAVLDDEVERAPVQSPQLCLRFGYDSRSARRVVQQRKFAESVPWPVLLQECRLRVPFLYTTTTGSVSAKVKGDTYKDFSAGESPLFHDIQVVSIIAFSDHSFAGFLADLLHSPENHFQLFWVQSTKHECLL